MPTPKFVMFTGNARKADEYRKALGRYAVKPEIHNQTGHPGTPDEQAATWLEGGALVVVDEKSNVYAPGGTVPLSLLRHMEMAVNRSTATVWSRKPDGTVTKQVYQHEVPGYINLHAPADASAFAWDVVFTPLGTGLTYNQTAELGLKNSARDLVLADIIRDVLHFERPVELNFHPMGAKRLVDFTVSPADYLADEPWLRTPAFQASPISFMLGSALQDGLFFRTSESRRERNYWLPGLNGGVPLVPKKDDIHELTFQFHDLMHAVMPDLVYDGSTDEAARKVYMVHRMISEAISLVAADAMFVDTLARSGCDYEFDKRHIYPLFASLKVDLGTMDGFRAAAWANTRYALLGLDDELVRLGADQAALVAYKAKYERFFAEDYRWTAANFDHMTSDAKLMQAWSCKMGPAFKAANLMTITGFIAEVVRSYGSLYLDNMRNLVTAVFDQCWNLSFERAARRGVAFGGKHFSAEGATSDAFLRYMLGQLVMYDRYAHIQSVAAMGDILRHEVVKGAVEGGMFTAADIVRMRAFHDAAVDHLFAISAISAEEQRLFKEVVPVFDPFFVFYEAKVSAPLVEVVEMLLGEQEG